MFVGYERDVSLDVSQVVRVPCSKALDADSKTCSSCYFYLLLMVLLSMFLEVKFRDPCSKTLVNVQNQCADIIILVI